jgi:hypothetical protein
MGEMGRKTGMATARFRLGRRSEARLVSWFRSASRPPVAYSLLGVAAFGYSLVALLLSVAKALPMPDPYLRIANQEFFSAAVFFYAPVIIAAWLLGSSAMYLVAWAMRSKPEFDQLLTATAFASGLGTLGTLVPDLVTSPLRALGVISEKAWETSIAEQGGWFVFTWITLVTYVALFLVAYPLALRQTTGLAWRKAIVGGVIGFLVFQGLEFVFIR